MVMTQAVVVDPLIERLRNAVRLRDVAAITERIKHELENFIPHEGLRLPQRFRTPLPDHYARRLLYRDAELDFTAVVMTWGPGQHTALHDHSGIWCVEGVVEGEMEVHRFELIDEEGPDLFRFEARDSAHACAGSAGALIPPFEHHVLANPREDRVALTLHVYGGDMDHCSVFEPLESPDSGNGLYRRSVHVLEYTA
ncbi:MAG TPA: cysteine dioxygenase family protein [Thermoanaerobaculia bacterium]|jgi:predicted metal-dependent enzyme (double-stranded beta helix superfamily)|nr:cysteine dioxygenase family protein [Thermoanaerobaculia bacterium]